MRSATAVPKLDSPFPGSPGTQTPSNFGAPAMTLSGYENRIREYTTEHKRPISRGQIKTLANRMHKREANASDANLARILQHKDPTADEAVRNVMAGGDRG